MPSSQNNVHSGLWSSILELSEEWSKTPIAGAVSEQLPRNNPPSSLGIHSNGVPSFLQRLNASYHTFLHPMMLGTRVQALKEEPLPILAEESLVDGDALNAWLGNATRLEYAHRLFLEWIRSRLPGYPNLRAPQLANGTPLTTGELTQEFIWHRSEFGRGTQYQSAPFEVPAVLGLESHGHKVLLDKCRAVADEASKSDAWRTFGRLVQSLSEDTKIQLRLAKASLRDQLTDEKLDLHEEHAAWPRLEYRTHTMDSAIKGLSGDALEYSIAFGEVNSLLGLVCCDIMGELSLYGPPDRIDASSLEFPHPGENRVQFKVPMERGLRLDVRQLIKLNTPLVKDAVRVENVSMSFDVATEEECTISGLILTGTAVGWSRP